MKRKYILTPAIYFGTSRRDTDRRALNVIDHSFAYALPYYPLHQFAENSVKRPLTSMILMDWEGAATKDGFIEFIKKYYPHKDLPDILAAIEKYYPD